MGGRTKSEFKKKINFLNKAENAGGRFMNSSLQDLNEDFVLQVIQIRAMAEILLTLIP